MRVCNTAGSKNSTKQKQEKTKKKVLKQFVYFSLFVYSKNYCLTVQYMIQYWHFGTDTDTDFRYSLAPTPSLLSACTSTKGAYHIVLPYQTKRVYR